MKEEVINLTAKTNAEEVGNQFSKLADDVEKVDKAESKLKKTNADLHASFEDVYDDIKPLTGQMGEMEDRLYQMALAGEQNTKEFKDLTKEVGKYRKIQIDTDLSVDAAAMTMNQKLGGALQGAVSGFGAVQGAMGLFGTESEEIESALLKVQSAMALSEGIKGLREGAKSFKALGLASTKAFKGMKGAFLATGIGAFVVTLGVIIAYWDEISEAVGFGTESIEDQENAVRDLEQANKDNLEVMKKTVENNMRYMKRSNEQVKNEEKIKNLQAEGGDNLKQINELTKANIQIELTNLQVRKESYFELLSTQEQLKLNQDIFRKQQELERTNVKKTRKVHRTHRKAVKKEMMSELEFSRMLEDLQFKQLEESTENEIKLLNIKYDRIIEDTKNNEKLKEKQKTFLIIEQEKLREQEINKIKQKNAEKEKQAEKERLNNLKKLRDEFETSLETETEIANARLLSEQELEIQAVQDKYFNLIEQAKQYGLDTQVLEDNQQKAIKEIDDRYREQKKKDDEADAEEKKALNQSIEDSKFKLASDTLNLISGINQLFGSENEEQAKRNFNIDKAVKIGQATTTGIQGAMNAFTTAQKSPITAVVPAYPAIQAGLAGAFAAVNIAKIAKTKFTPSGDGGGGGDLNIGGAGGGSGSGGLDTGSANMQPSFNIVGETGLSDLADIQQQPTQAYVVSGDVTTAQSLDRNRINNATI